MASYYNRKLVRHQQPASEPVTLAEAKLFLRVENNDEDSLISEMITAAREAAENTMRRSIALQQWKLSYDANMPSVITLPMGDVQSVISVTSTDSEGTETTIDASHYHLDKTNDKLVFNQSFVAHGFNIIYSAGVSDNTMIPMAVKHAILSHIAAMYDSRGDRRIPASSLEVYNNFRKISLY